MRFDIFGKSVYAGLLATLFGVMQVADAALIPIQFSPGDSLGVFNVGSGTVTFNTDPVSGGAIFGTGRTTTVFSNVVSGGVTVRVFDFDSINVSSGATIIAVGSMPLILTSGGEITWDGTLFLSGLNGENNTDGGGGGGAGGGALGLFANDRITIGTTGQIISQGGDGGSGLTGTSNGGGGMARAGGGNGGDGGDPAAGGKGGNGGNGGAVIGRGGGGGGGGAYAGGGGAAGASGFAVLVAADPGDAGEPGNCDENVNGGRGGRGAGVGVFSGDRGAAGAAPGGAGGAGGSGKGGLGGGGGGGGGATQGGGGGPGGPGSGLGGGGGGGGGADACKHSGVTPGTGGNAASGGGGGSDGKPGGDGKVVTANAGSRGGAGGGGSVALGSLIDEIVQNGLVSLSGGDSDGLFGPEGGRGVLFAYGTLSGTGTNDAITTVSSGIGASDWFVTGGSGGGGSGGPGNHLPEPGSFALVLLGLPMVLTGALMKRGRRTVDGHC